MSDCTFTAPAVRDYFAALRHYARLRPKEAQRFAQHFEYTVHRIITEGLRIPRHGYDCYAIVVFDYSDYILYDFDENRPVIVGVANAHRGPDYWKGQRL